MSMLRPNQGSPEILALEQPVVAGFDMGDLGVMTDAMLRGACAGIVIRRGQYNDFIGDILGPISEEFGLESAATVDFARKPIGTLGKYVPGQRETFHLDVGDATDRKRKVEFPYALTVSNTEKGIGKLLVGSASGKVRAWTIEDYNRYMMRINNDPRLLTEIRKHSWTGLNRQINIQDKGLRGPVGAIHLNEGDVALIPQGGEGSVLPSWHSIVTQDIPRTSKSYHLRKK